MKNEIFLVRYPFTDSLSSKARPALCLTEPTGRFGEAIFAVITNQKPSDPQLSDIELDPQSDAGSSTQLRKLSHLRLHRLFALNQSIVGRRIGELSPALQEEVARKLRSLFSL